MSIGEKVTWTNSEVNLGWVADFVRGDKIGNALVCLFLATISALGFAFWFRDFLKEDK